MGPSDPAEAAPGGSVRAHDAEGMARRSQRAYLRGGRLGSLTNYMYAYRGDVLDRLDGTDGHRIVRKWLDPGQGRENGLVRAAS